MGSTSGKTKFNHKKGGAYSLLKEYGDMEFDVKIYSRDVKGIGGSLFGWEHKSIVIDHHAHGYIVIEWVKPGLYIYETNCYKFGRVGLCDKILREKVKLSKVIETAQDICRGRKYSLRKFNCNHFVQVMENWL